jgi:hypothetical protein
MIVNMHQVQYNWFTSASLFAVILAVVVVNGISAHARLQSTSPSQKAESRVATDQPGFYCNLKALSPAERERLHQVIEKLKGARIETKELPDGYAFRLQTELISIGELAEYVSSERKCCPFFDFEIELQRDGGPLWLRLRGKEGVKEFMRHEFGIQ